MPYLAINNYAVSCKEASTGFKEAGSRGYNQANRYFLNRAGRDKREWKFETIPLSNDDAQSLIGMLQMRGEHFPFASSTGGAPQGGGVVERSQKGRTRAALAEVRAHPNRAADGGLVYLMGGALQTPYIDFTGNSSLPYQGALWPHKGFTNVLSVANANPEEYVAPGDDLTVAGNGSLSTETNRRWTGTGCVKWTPGTAGNGLRTDNNLTLGATTRYVASAYVKGSIANQLVDINAYDSGGAFITSGNITLPASTDAWMRIWAAGTTVAAPGAASYVEILAGTADAFYVDGLQLCAVTSITNPGPWYAGGTVATQMQLEYDNTFLRDMKDGLTVNAWVYRIDSSYTSWPSVLHIANSDYDRALIVLEQSNTGRMRFNVNDGTDLTRTDYNYIAQSTTVLNSAWHMITGTWDPSTTASPLTPAARIYVDGVLEGTDTTNAYARAVDWHDPGLFTDNLTIGYRGAVGGVPDSAGLLISHLSILPFTASANIIAGWYGTPAATDPPLSFFPLTCSGDFLASDERWISAFGEVTDVENIQVFDGGVWNTNYKKIKFTLTEA